MAKSGRPPPPPPPMPPPLTLPRTRSFRGSMRVSVRSNGRDSVRTPSRGSVPSRSSSSTSISDPREKVKDCCRKVVAFMCTQVGVGGLVVGYALVGAVGFMYIETKTDDAQVHSIKALVRATSLDLWDLTADKNIFHEKSWRSDVDWVLKQFQNNVTIAVKSGYDGRTAAQIWSFPAALMFSLSIITMIGFGNLVPKTPWGKAMTVCYAVFGIPLYVLYFMNMGKVMAQCFRWIYTRMYECTSDRPRTGDGAWKRITVPATTCAYVLLTYVLIGTFMFANWEEWDYMDSFYFCMTSLCKIGFGDFVPGATGLENSTVTAVVDPNQDSQIRLVANFVYLLFGLGLIAMVYNLVREGFRLKYSTLKADMRLCLDQVHLKTTSCFRPAPAGRDPRFYPVDYI